VERRRARSDAVQLTCHRFWMVPRWSHWFLIKAVPFPAVIAVFFGSPSREYDRPVSPLERMPGEVATHQLLSGPLGPGPTPMVSYLCDCGDRGFRPSNRRQGLRPPAPAAGRNRPVANSLTLCSRKRTKSNQRLRVEVRPAPSRVRPSCNGRCASATGQWPVGGPGQ